MERREFLKAATATAAAVLTGAVSEAQANRRITVLVWDEQQEEQVKSGAYKNYLGNAIAEFLSQEEDLRVISANIHEREQGLTEERLQSADVILWWGHVRHREVDDSKVETIVSRVRAGLTTFVALHSAHFSKPFTRLLGTRCGFAKVDSRGGRGWREWLRVTNPHHPIADGVKDFEIPRTEIYGEPFEVPMPNAIVLYGYWETGDSFPDCCYWTVGPQGVPSLAQDRLAGGGKVVYFRPGHETFPIFLQPEVQTVIRNIVRWGAPKKA
jgi:trehalose utilization protein